MHFEVLVEDLSGKEALEVLIPKIVGSDHSYNIHPYKGIGRIPKGLKGGDADKRILLNQLPRLLNGYGKTFASYPESYPVAVILVCDLDDKNLAVFLEELGGLLENCYHRPETRFCIAIEEGESWFLGDLSAVYAVYPNAKRSVLNKYVNDSICGTWEILADAVYPGGASRLKEQGWWAAGAEKTEWAKAIAPHMDVDNNKSPSFCFFRDCLRSLC